VCEKTAGTGLLGFQPNADKHDPEFPPIDGTRRKKAIHGEFHGGRISL